MASETMDLIDDLAKQSLILFEKLEQRRAAAAKLQTNFLRGLRGDIEIEYQRVIDVAPDMVSEGDSVPQELRPESDEQHDIDRFHPENKGLLDTAAEVTAQETMTMENQRPVLVRIQPDYETVIDDAGTTLEIRKLPVSSPDRPVSKLDIGMALSNILAYAQGPAKFSAGCADLPGAARRLRKMIFTGLGRSDGQCPTIIDAIYNDTPDRAPGTEYLQVDPDTAFYKALVGSDLGSIVPNFLLANVAAITIPVIGNICVKREVQPRMISTTAVLDLTADLEKTLAEFVLDVEKDLEGETMSLEIFRGIIDKAKQTAVSAFKSAASMEKLADEATEYVYCMSFELPG